MIVHCYGLIWVQSKFCTFRNILNECLLENHKIIIEQFRSHGKWYSLNTIQYSMPKQ